MALSTQGLFRQGIAWSCVVSISPEMRTARTMQAACSIYLSTAAREASVDTSSPTALQLNSLKSPIIRGYTPHLFWSDDNSSPKWTRSGRFGRLRDISCSRHHCQFAARLRPAASHQRTAYHLRGCGSQPRVVAVHLDQQHCNRRDLFWLWTTHKSHTSREYGGAS